MLALNHIFTMLMLVALLVSACQPIQAPGAVGRVEWKTETFTSPALADNLIGDPTERPITILLPPSYGASNQRYPVVYVLHGYGDNAIDIAEPMKAALEPLLASGEVGELILVFPDCTNRWGGCMYLNSPTLGNYETYITQDLVNYVDMHYRTIPERNSRGITGCSMGGVGAIHLALKYPEVFSVSAPVSGVYDRERDPLLEMGVAGYTRTLTLPSDFDTLPFLTQPAIATAAMAAPNSNNPPFYFDLVYEVVDGTGQIRPEVWQKVVDGDPAHEVHTYIEQPVRLRNILIYHGDADQLFSLEQPATFDKLLTELGVEHEYLVGKGGHCTLDYTPVLQFMAEHLVFDPSSMQANQPLAKLTGSWQVETTVVQQAATFPALITFTSDGIVIADEPPSPFETSGHGNWIATGPDTADFTFLALIGSAEGPLSATIKVVGSLQYDSSADTWEGPFTVQVVDAQGAELLADQGTFKGTRIAVEKAGLAAQLLKPGDRIGEMSVVKGPDPFDLNIPPIPAFCNTNPFFASDAKVATPGTYTVECAMPPLPQLMVGFGWVAINPERRDIEWAAVTSELYINQQAVDQSQFGTLDADVPVTGVPGMEASEVVTQSLRTWNVLLENLQPGPMTLRWGIQVNQELNDGVVTVPAGTYDTIFKITVDESLANAPGESEPVVLIQQTKEVFDAFNAAVNAHDVDKALSFFADDAIAQFPNPPPPNVHTGSAEIREWLETDIKNNIHVEIADIKTSGDTVSATASVDVEDLPPDIVLVGTVEVTVKNGKITSFTYTLNDETLAKLTALEPK